MTPAGTERQQAGWNRSAGCVETQSAAAAGAVAAGAGPRGRTARYAGRDEPGLKESRAATTSAPTSPHSIP
ncbi:MAG TPA: hypothetical protein VFV65_04665, partial [Gemmatimonadales bacterium]|nr:hypothetical protein [Gemmatimonadales bacterium]